MVLSTGADAPLAATTMVGSVAFATADPPPETLTTLASGDAALTPTFTVIVIDG
jgi:hypothetical protein